MNSMLAFLQVNGLPISQATEYPATQQSTSLANNDMTKH